MLGVAPEDFSGVLYVVDPAGRIAYCTSAFANLVGKPVSEIVGRLSVTFYEPDQTPIFLMRRVRALSGERVEPELETAIRVPGGSRRVGLTVTTLRSATSAVLGRVAIVRGIADASRAGTGSLHRKPADRKRGRKAGSFPVPSGQIQAAAFLAGSATPDKRISQSAP